MNVYNSHRFKNQSKKKYLEVTVLAQVMQTSEGDNHPRRPPHTSSSPHSRLQHPCTQVSSTRLVILIWLSASPVYHRVAK